MAPPLLAINLEGQAVRIDKNLTLKSEDNTTNTYNLCGIIYLGEFHFISRIIDKNRRVWFYDGATFENQKGVEEGELDDFDGKELIQCKNKKASLVLYVLDSSVRMGSPGI